MHEAAGVWTPWLAVELVAGGSVAERVRERGPLDVLESVAVTRGVLAALGALHAAGYVHRDVTPGNVLLAGPRSAAPVGGVLTAADVRLADFGTADASGRVALARAGGGVVGTAAFISPEQAAGLPVRAAADLYQAGALLYFMLTGQPPFPRATPAQVVDAHLSAPPPVPSALARDARPLDRIVTRAMTKTPARRFRDAEEFSVALAEVATLLSPAALPHADTSVDAHRTKVLTTTTDPRPGLDYLTPAPAPTPVRTPVGDPFASTRRNRGLGWLAAATLMLVLAGAAVWYSTLRTGALEPGGQVRPMTVAAPTTAPSTTPEPSPEAAPSPTPEPVVLVGVPALKGTADEAAAALQGVGLGVGRVAEQDSVQPAGVLLAQAPAAGKQLQRGASVDLTVASGRNVVPDVTGLTVAQAVLTLQAAGFGAQWEAGMGSRDLVDATLPVAGQSIALGTDVKLVAEHAVAQPRASATPTPAASPTPSPTRTPSPTPSATQPGEEA